MKLLILTFLLSISLLANSIEWQNNYKTALESAKKENKLLFVFITSKNCKFCKKLKETTLKNKDIVNKINKDYISVIVMKDKDYFPSKLNAKATPMIYFLDKDENIIDYSLGYWDVVDFNFILKDVKKRLDKRKKQ
ncbi:thioredoxin family protein [Sulfurimonas sp.]|uniref:thioredoxin family protein n=1 Tax=Sulfurimonas sp. TaxID=2022749 RepID=UPI0035656E1A